MLDHHIQRSIVYALAFSPSLRFSELQPDDIDSKLFTYHLKKVIVAGLVEKYDDGTYALTPEGRRVGKSILRRDRFMDQAYSILLLVVRRPRDGAWLLYTRGTHPLIGLTGFMQATPMPTEDITVTAARTCQEKTGLTATFSTVSSGFFRVFEGDALESFTHFTVLVADDASGDLSANDEFGSYAFVTNPDFTSGTMLPTALTLSQLATDRSTPFVEKTFQL